MNITAGKIVTNSIINSVSSIRKVQYEKGLANLATDVFQKRAIPQAITPKSPLKLDVLSGVSEDFASKTINQINGFSPYWLQKFKQEGYKVILAPNLEAAYKKEGVFDKSIRSFEAKNPEGTLGMTFANSKGKKFFVFCDKPLAEDKYIPSIVNHELSHGIVNISGITQDKKALEALKQDILGIVQGKKLDKLAPEERALVSRYFFSQKAHLPLDELSADICAWNFDKGLYGSGLIYGVDNPDLMTGLFPDLTAFLKKITL